MSLTSASPGWAGMIGEGMVWHFIRHGGSGSSVWVVGLCPLLPLVPKVVSSILEVLGRLIWLPQRWLHLPPSQIRFLKKPWPVRLRHPRGLRLPPEQSNSRIFSVGHMGLFLGTLSFFHGRMLRRRRRQTLFGIWLKWPAKSRPSQEDPRPHGIRRLEDRCCWS